MATRSKSSPASTKKSTVKKTSPKKTSAPAKKPAKKRTAPKAAASQKVDYYPNRMTLAVAVLAGTILVLISLITVLGVQ